MKTIILGTLVACVVLSSCSSGSSEEVYVPKDSSGNPIPVNTNIPVNENKAQVQAPVGQPNAPQLTPTVSTQMTPAQQQADIQRQIQEQMAAQQAKMSATTTTATPTTTAPGMNPPHGQPNHRCDIAVGAPLNSKPNAPATTAPVVTTTQQPAQTVTTTQQPVVTAPGMNPPHGQPNHRCDIAVGAPLNSKPTTPVTTTTTPVVTSTQVPAATAAKKDSGQ